MTTEAQRAQGTALAILFEKRQPALQDHLAEAIRQHKIAGENARNVYKLTPKGAQK